MIAAPGDPRWAAALAAFDEVVELDEAARRLRLQAIGVSDPELQRTIERLLLADAQADGGLTRFDVVLGESARDSDPLRLVGCTVSHFRIIEPLGRGGMGVVYRAEDTRLRRMIAVKFPLAAQYIDPAAVERFRQEARAAAALDHPNLCPVYDVGETADGDLFYAMPLYEGETLKARLARDGRLSLAQVLKIAAQLASGLGAAHRAGIVHRDLKPANVMLLPDDIVKILDFGLAKASDLSLTVSWARLGTVAYMAPEQVHGHEVDGRADLWALGVVLYEMVTGSRPFGAGHEIGVAHAILHEEPPRASTLGTEVPPALDDIIHGLLSREPADRYGSAEELATALGRIRFDGTRGADHPSDTHEAAPSPRRFRLAAARITGRSARRAWMLGATPLLALLAAGVAVLALRSTTATSAPTSLAVLPFSWRGDSAATHHLAVGLTDGIGNGLSRLRGVVAPSYVTTSIYRDGVKTLKQIGAELQVSVVLRGSVERVEEGVRVDAHLIDVRSGEPLWDRRYERPAGELPELERDIKRATLATLRIRPSAAEQESLDRPATTNARAYDLYLRGRAIELAGQSRELWQPVPIYNTRRAQSLYSQARELDPGFATARARLALMHTLAATTYDTTAARREYARVEAEAALRLRPGLPEAHEALASYWSLNGDVERSIDQLRLALEGFPHSADLHRALGDNLWAAARLDDAAREYERATQLEPGSAKGPLMAAVVYGRLRRREEAQRAYDRAIAVAPDYHMAKVIKGHAYLRWYGISDTLGAAMRNVPADWDPDGTATYAKYEVLWTQRRYADALAMLDSSRVEFSRSDRLLYLPISLMRARIHEALGNRNLARASYAAARALLEDSVDAHPSDPSIRVSLAMAYAGLGRTAEAVREARRALEMPGAGTAAMGGVVEVFAMVGEFDAAFDMLELLFSMPAGREVTVAFLRVWPGFDPLRSDPRFEELLTRFAALR